MQISPLEQAFLDGKHGLATQKAMRILEALGTIYAARRMIPVSSVQISGVSYDNLGEEGLEFLREMAAGGGQTRIKTTLNPAGMDIENWHALGISDDFACKQLEVINVFTEMGVTPTCTCTPYLAGNTPQKGDHIAWAESSAVCYANSVLGARTNREGGPSALAAALTGVTPEYGLHLAENRRPGITFKVQVKIEGTHYFGLLGRAIGVKLERLSKKFIPLITGINNTSLEELKSLCASIATYGGAALFHICGITPEAGEFTEPQLTETITERDIELAYAAMSSTENAEIDFVSLGCPHLSIDQVARIAQLVQGKKVKKTFWITTSRHVKHQADQLGYTGTIESAGAVFATDTCCVVAPIVGRFAGMATDSAKACYYAASRNKFKVRIMTFDEVVENSLL